MIYLYMVIFGPWEIYFPPSIVGSKDKNKNNFEQVLHKKCNFYKLFRPMKGLKYLINMCLINLNYCLHFRVKIPTLNIKPPIIAT